MAIEVKGGSSEGLPKGWVIQSNIDIESGRRRVVATGPYSTVVEARAALLSKYEKIWHPLVNHQPGSPSASIEFYLKGYSWSLGESADEPEQVAPAQWSLQPISQQVEISALPKYADISARIAAIKDAISRGDIPSAIDNVTNSDLAEQFLGLYTAGVRTYQALAYSYSYTRTFAYGDAARVRSYFGTLNQQANKVFAWADVEGSDDCPVNEPKWVEVAGNGGETAKSFEWRLDGVSISGSEDGDVVVACNYTGAYQWAAALYPGGSWVPSVVQEE